jgi:hypothetical protein
VGGAAIMSAPVNTTIKKKDFTRKVTVRRLYGKDMIEHVVTENGKDAEIKIEMPLEPFIHAVIGRVIFECGNQVGSPLFIMTKAALAKKFLAGLDQKIDSATEAEIMQMKTSTLYKTKEAP